MKKALPYFLTVGIFLMVASGVYINVSKQLAVNRSKIPEKVEDSKGFQRWITNLKNKGYEIEADEFTLDEEVEIYNTKWMKVYTLDTEGVREQYDTTIAAHRDLKKVIFSPSDRQFIDYRNEDRNGYLANEVHYYGLREDKIVDARILDCSPRAHCLFDRAYFLDNDVFVISELSRTIDKKDPNTPICGTNEVCEYSFKLHVIDLNKNSRLIYESKPFNAIRDELVQNI